MLIEGTRTMACSLYIIGGAWTTTHVKGVGDSARNNRLGSIVFTKIAETTRFSKCAYAPCGWLGTLR